MHARVAALNDEARRKLPIGSKQEVLARFSTEHNIPLTVEGRHAYGSAPAAGCSPFGCGSDAAVIVMRVEVDEFGNTKDIPHVDGMYMDCL